MDSSEAFLRQINVLNEHPLCLNVFSQFCNKTKNLSTNEWISLLNLVGNVLVQPQFTLLVGGHLRPWLPELLPRLAAKLSKYIDKTDVAQHHIKKQRNISEDAKSCPTGNLTSAIIPEQNVREVLLTSKNKKTADKKIAKDDSPPKLGVKRSLELKELEFVEEALNDGEQTHIYSSEYLTAHQSVCRVLATLLPISPNVVRQFILQYFESHPAPFFGTSSTKVATPPPSKKQKLTLYFQVEAISDEKILECTYMLVLSAGPELSSLWQWQDLLAFIYATHTSTTRWLACQCIGALTCMTETELSTFTTKHIDAQLARDLDVSYLHKQQQQQLLVSSLPQVWTETVIEESVASIKEHSVCIDKKSKDRKGIDSENLPNGQSDASCEMPLKYTTLIGKNLLPVVDGGKKGSPPLVQVPSTCRNLQHVWCGVAAGRPVLLEGPVGCGKTAMVEHVAALTGRRVAPLISKVQLGSQTDAKALLGTYRCTATPGEFVWVAGVLTRAVTAGHWLLLEDVDNANVDVVAVITSLVEDRVLVVPGTGAVHAHRHFRLFATRRLSPHGGSKGIMGAGLCLEALWCKVQLESLSRQELVEVVVARYPRLKDVADRLVSVFITLAPGQHPEARGGVTATSDSGGVSASILNRQSVTADSASGRLVCCRDLLKWAARVNAYTELHGAVLADTAFQEALDCFCAAVPDPSVRDTFAEQIASYLNLSAAVARRYCHDYRPEVSVEGLHVRVGERATLKKLPVALPSMTLVRAGQAASDVPYSFTRKSCVLLERIAVALSNKEPVLIVGETGTGKTTAVQYLAHQTHHKLKVINMNQQSDATDLLGGFKPVEMKTILFPLREEFEGLFHLTMPEKANFLRHVLTSYGKRQWKTLLDLMAGTEKVAIEKLESRMSQLDNKIKQLDGKSKDDQVHIVQARKRKKLELKLMHEKDLADRQNLVKERTETVVLLKKWGKLRIKLEQAKGHVEKSQSALAFSFIEGALTRAVAEGDWVLLDEINLASAETLECLSSLLEGERGSLTLLERGDERPLVRHPRFRLLACMNPATDVGKRELAPGLRNRFTEIFMEDLTSNEDLETLIRDYLLEQDPTPRHVQGIRRFYCDVRGRARMRGELVDTTGAAPHYTLRTLCRALRVAARNPAGNFKRSLYEAFSLSFLTQLDRSSHPIVENLILKHLILPKKAESIQASKNLNKNLKLSLSKVLPHPCRVLDTVDGDEVSRVPEGAVVGDWVMASGYWIAKGSKQPSINENYILTESVCSNMRSVSRVVSLGEGSPVLLQGDTSVGKTSLVTYLALKCGVPCIRINNHEHTDIQEYLGCYSPDDSGKLVFREGALVTAMRRGHWIILDELNLAPTDVLEALNRLLDDNRELYLPETQETVRAHSNFRLFATQNPPGLYGGRKILSRAFRNRFVELHFDDIPGEELVEIIHKRCCLSVQHSKKLVAVLQGLQIRRGRENMFQGRHSLVTLRDLFRWAERYHLAQKPDETGQFYDWEQHLADEGYLVLAGRVRIKEETDIIRQVIEEKLRCKIDPGKLFTLSKDTSPVTRPILEKLQLVTGFEHLVFTEDMRRLYVLLSKCLSFSEPVLLVGETGCGKTTVCQMIAAMKEQQLYSINCHMHTEGADFLGGLRPVRHRSDEDDKLFEWVDGPLIHAMRNGGMFLADEISLADDSVLERLNSVLEPERTLVLAEKGSDCIDKCLETEVVVAHQGFRLIGTMNPGGDYGKKELSPAMRNRFTEIWCPKIEITRASSDVLKIVEHNLRRGLILVKKSRRGKSGLGVAMVAFLKQFTQSELGRKCTISIRDIISWVQFINKVTSEEGGNMDVGLAYIHGACLVLLDGLGSGLTGSGLMGWKQLKAVSLNFLYQQVWQITSRQPDRSTLEEHCITGLSFVDDEHKFGITPFIVDKGQEGQDKDKTFTFVAPRTCINLMRILRSLQLNRPLLLEGSPGVGKTSLVVALAKATNNEIVRINLSEQTDVSDLFGADLPVEGSSGGRFAWRDGPLLQALRNGSWVVLDELNLASQSVLEGLNACFDHRGEVFVPELGQTFKVSHKVTKLFACQNPQHEGGARKGLPRSFLNRFTQVHIEPLSSGDLHFILSNVYGDKVHTDTLRLMVEFNKRLVESAERGEWGMVGGPWELNLRDLFRWCELTVWCSPPDHRRAVELLYGARMRTAVDRAYVGRVFHELFEEGRGAVPVDVPLLEVTQRHVRVGGMAMDRLSSGPEVWRCSRALCVLPQQLPLLQQLICCVQRRWLVLLVGGAGTGKSAAVQQLAALAGNKLHTVALTPNMDVGELLGGFEQVDYGRRLGSLVSATNDLVTSCVKHQLLSPTAGADNAAASTEGVTVEGAAVRRLLRLRADLLSLHAQQALVERSSSEELRDFLKKCDFMQRLLKEADASCSSPVGEEQERCSLLLQEVLELRTRVQESGGLAAGGVFEWVDSPLVTAIRTGQWVVVEGASLCPPSVLDRLNPLLEPGGQLLLSERGVVGGSVPCVTPHPSFRMFLTLDPGLGELSRAMRNRGVELYLPPLLQVSDLLSCGTKVVSNVDTSSDSGRSTASELEEEHVEDNRNNTEEQNGGGLSCSGSVDGRKNAHNDDSWDVTALLVSAGVWCPRLQAALVTVHREVSRALPAYLQPGVSVLLQAARLCVQLRQAGEGEVEALAVAARQEYLRCHGDTDLQQRIQQVVSEVLRVTVNTSHEEAPLLTSTMVLQTRALQHHRAQTLYVFQATNYLRGVLLNNGDRDAVQGGDAGPLTWVERFPAWGVAASEILTSVLMNLPVVSWPTLVHAVTLSLGNLEDGKRVAALLRHLVAEKMAGRVLGGLQLLVKDEECPADPRCRVGRGEGERKEVDGVCQVESTVNRVYLAVWRIIRKQLDRNCQSKTRVPPSKELSLLQLSKAVNEKKVSKNALLHQCVLHLHPFMVQMENFIKSFTSCSDFTLSLTDEMFNKLMTTLRWKDRLNQLCTQPFSSINFDLLLSNLVLHWQFLEENLLKDVPQSWSLCQQSLDKLQRKIDKMNKAFASKCGPVHRLAQRLSESIDRPKPCVSEACSQLRSGLVRLDIVMKPDIKRPEHNVFLAGEDWRQAKHQLIGIAVDYCQQKYPSASSGELLARVTELEECLMEALTQASAPGGETSKGQQYKLCLLRVQSWPVVDYVASHLLQWILDREWPLTSREAERVQELLAVSVSLPLDLLESGKGGRGCVLAHMAWALSNTSASRNPKLWASYPAVLKREHGGCIASDGEDLSVVDRVSSSLSCLLTYILSAGTDDGTLHELKVGLHSEKAAQLQSIGSTIWSNWQVLASPESSPKVLYARSVISFAKTLYFSLSNLLIPDMAPELSLEQRILQVNEQLQFLLPQHLCSRLMEEIKTGIVSLEAEPTDMTAAARLGVAVAALQGWLSGHMEAMDPAEKRKLLLHYKRGDVVRIKQQVLQHSWMNILKGGKPLSNKLITGENPINCEHPHLSLNRDELCTATAAVVKLSQEVAYRSEEQEYISLTQDIDHFLQTAFNPEVICDMISNISARNLSLLATEQLDRKLITFENFFRHIHKQYPLFRDVTSLFLEGLAFTTRSLRVLLAQGRARLADATCERSLTKLLQDVSCFPVLRDPQHPLQHLPRLPGDVECLASLLSAADGHDRGSKKCQSHALQAVMHELCTGAVTAGRLNVQMSRVLGGIVSVALMWWRKQEEEKKRKEEEEASLFKYKAKEHAKNETEDETVEREFAETFPSYENDFDDLNEVTLEKVTKKKDKENDTDEENDVSFDWLTETQLWEISEVHQDLLTTLPYSPLQDSTRNCSSDAATPDTVIQSISPVPSALHRLKVLHAVMNAIGPVADCDLDRTSIGAYLVFNHSTCQSLSDHQTAGLLKKPANFYVDARPSEATKLRPLLIPLLHRIDELLQQWPEHPTLVLVSRVAERVLEYSITAPLAKLLAGLESILLKAAIWEANAHRGVSLLIHLNAIKTQVVEWRRLELQEWRSCLDLVSHGEAVASKLRWWPHLYECLARDSWDAASMAVLAETLKNLMESSTLGDYEAKLMLIQAFHRHLIVSKSPCSAAMHLTSNIYSYYLQFLPHVKFALAKERKVIETKVKETVKVANYSIATFRDISQVREKVNKCCQALHSQMRVWKKFLQTQDREVWAKDSGEELKGFLEGVWDAAPAVVTTATLVLPPAVMPVKDIARADSTSVLRSLSGYTSKARELVLDAIEAMPYSDCVEGIEEVTAAVITSYHKLSRDASLCVGETDKEVRLAKLKSVMKLRRSSVTRLFQQLQIMGVRFRRGNALWMSDHAMLCFQAPTCHSDALYLDKRTMEQIRQLFSACDKYFFRCLNRLQLVNERVASPHADLSPDLIKRMLGASKHLMLLSLDLRTELSLLASNLNSLRLLAEDIDCAPSVPIASVSSIQKMWRNIHAFSLSLSLSAAEVRVLINTKSEAASLVPSFECESSPSLHRLTEAKQLLTDVESKCTAVAQTSGKMIAAFSDDAWPRIVNESHVELVGELNEQLGLISQMVTSVISCVDSKREGRMCLSRELVKWLNRWTEVTRDIEDWLREVSTSKSCDDSHCDASYSLLELDNCTNAVLYAVQTQYKKHATTGAQDEKQNESEKGIITEATVESLLSDVKALKLNYVLKCVKNMVADVSEGANTELQSCLTQVGPLLMQYIALGENILLSAAAGSRCIGKFTSVLLAIFYQMATNGFCRPQELEDQEGGQGGKLSFEDDDTEAAGLADGEGKKDMSDKLESEDQLESALQEGEKEKPGDKDIEEEDGGVEMSNDFEGKLQDKDKPEPGDDEDDEEQEQDTHDQIGETEQGAETLDKKLWNEKEEEEGEENGDLEEDENAQGNDNEMETQVVAKEKGKQDKEEERKKDGKEEDAQEKADKPEEMEEDRRQPNKASNEDDYDDEFEDKRAGEDRKDQDKDPEEPLELSEDLKLDEAEEEKEEEKNGVDEDGGDEDKGEDVNPLDIDKKALFPDGKDLECEEDKKEEDKQGMDELPEEQNEDNDDGQEKTTEDMENTQEDFNAKEADAENDDVAIEKEHKKNAGLDDGDEPEKEKEGDDDETDEEKVGASKDRDTNLQAEAAQIDAKDASKDKTKETPDTEDGGKQLEEEDRQEEAGQPGQRTQESLGVGESQAPPPKDDLHSGEESAVTTDTSNTNAQNEEKKRRKKPGDVDEEKCTGDSNAEVKQGLLTSMRRDLSQVDKPEDEDMEDNNDNEDEDDGKQRDSDMWQVVRESQQHQDGQVVDAGTREQAVEAPAPVQDDTGDEPMEEGVMQEIMEVDNPEDPPSTSIPEKRPEDLTDGPSARDPQQQGQTDESPAGGEAEERILTEGEAVLEHTVQRPPQTYFHTLLEHEQLTAEAQFEEDVTATKARLQESAARLTAADEGACQSWASHQANVAPYAAQLCDQLRLILEPTEAARLKGDYRTGKRLNMRKVIGYIASHFLKDKIWLRRTQPSKRSYHVLLAIDDSESMKTVQAEELAKQSICLVAQALTKLEVGKVGVLSFGSSTTVLHPLDEPFSDASGARIFANLRFDQSSSRFLELLESSVTLLRGCRNSGGGYGNPDTAQILLIISDGQTHANSERLRAAVTAARNERIFIVFFVLDAAAKHSFYDIQVWDAAASTLRPLAEQFPFPFYLVVRDLTTLPHVLAEALRRWFELVAADATY